MKTAVVIGASGHVGSYAVPQLVRDGYRVVAVSRGIAVPYTRDQPEWTEVEMVAADRSVMDKAGTFGAMIASFHPDVVCDTIAYEMKQTRELCEALAGSDVHLVQIGTIWVYDQKYEVPVTEDHPRTSKCEYGSQKTMIEQYLMELVRNEQLRMTILQPGHVCGRGWIPVNPQGNRDLQVYRNILAGNEILLPDNGQATLHHVHSADLSGLLSLCLKKPEVSQGRVFHSTTVRACTLMGFAEFLFRYYGHKPNIRYLPWPELEQLLSAEDRGVTREHIQRSPACSMEKAEKLLGFIPRYNSMDTILDSLHWMIDKGILERS